MTCIQTASTGATGARPITAWSRQILRDLAARAPQAGDVERNRLYPVLEGAKVALRLGTPALETLKHLISFTRPDDWKGDRTPLAWPSNYTLAELAGVTEGAIKARLRQLRALGLVAAHDSAHGRRTGRRDATGAITSGYGLDLSPLRIRFAELQALAEAHSAQSRLFKEGRLAIARARRLVGQVLAQAAEMGLTGAHWLALQERVDRIVEQAAQGRVSRDSEAYQEALDRIVELERAIDEMVDRFMFPSNEPMRSKSSPVLDIQTKPSPDSVAADQGCGSGPAAFPTSPSGSVFKARPADLMTMFPTMAMYVTANHPGWPDLHAAAARLRHDLGIRTSLWLDALDRLGRDGAAVAMMITAERLARGEIRSNAGAYFSGMMTKACRDELDLGRSLWWFREAVAAG